MKKLIICMCAIVVMFALSPAREAFAGPPEKTAKKHSVSKNVRKKRKRAVFTCDQYSRTTLNRKSKRFKKTINHASKKYGVSPNLIKAVIAVESCFNPRAKGGLGEKGLMQLMPSTARMLGVKNGYSPWQNIHGGTKYLKNLLVRFNGNKRYAAAAYNGGPGAVSRTYGPKFKQVKRYSRHVMRAYTTLSGGKNKSYRPSAKSRKVSLKRSSKKQRRLKRTNKRYKQKIRTSKQASKSRTHNKARTRQRKFYRVKQGNTLYSIAKASRVSVTKLKRLNGLSSNTIEIGTRLKLQ